MKIYFITSSAIMALWGIYGLYGAIMVIRSGRGDIAWWIWPPVIFAFLPYGLVKILFNVSAAELTVVIINIVLVLIALGAYAFSQGKKKRRQP